MRTRGSAREWFIYTLAGLVLAGLLYGLGGCAAGPGAPASVTAGVGPNAGFALPAPQSIARSARYVNSDRKIQAYNYEDIGGGSDDRVEPSGTAAIFSPQYSGAQPLYITDAARAAYRFDVPGFTGPSEINLKWITPAPAAKNLWIGMANWDENHWEWFQGTNKRIVVDSLENYQSATNGILVAVVLLGSGIGGLAALDWIRIGPELWRIEAVTSGHDCGMYSNIAVGADDLPHIACYDADGKNLMYYHQEADGTWTSTMIDEAGDVGLYPSIAIRPSGGPAIAYFDATNSKLELATYWESAWQKMTVDSASLAGWNPSLQYGSDDYPRLAYFKLNHTLRYAVYDELGFT